MAIASLLVTAFGCVAAEDLLGPESSGQLAKSVRSSIFDNLSGGILTTPLSDAFRDFSSHDIHVTVSSVADAVSAQSSMCMSSAEHSLSSEYEEILANAKWSKDLLSESERSQIGLLRAKLLVQDSTLTEAPTERYAIYLKLKQAVDDAQRDLQNTPLANQTQVQKDRLKKSKEDLKILGDEATWKPLDSQFKELSGRQKNTRSDHYHKIWPAGGAAIARNGHELYPKLESIQELAWTTYSFSVAAKADAPSWVGDHLTVSFKWIRLQVVRPWFDAELFRDDSWNVESPIADGVGGGKIGSYVTGIVLVKDVAISVNAIREAKIAIRELSIKSPIVSFGPFPVIDISPDSGPFVITIDYGQKQLLIPQTLLFGCIRTVAPKSPNPNTAYSW